MLNRGSAKPQAANAVEGTNAPDAMRGEFVPLMDYGPSVFLVPNSGIQFMDFGFGAQDLASVRHRFFEEQYRAEDGTESSLLHSVVFEDSVLRHPLTLEPLSNDETMAVSGADAMKPFLDQWLPIPFMRVLGKTDIENQQLDEGPVNWARIFVTAVSEVSGKENSAALNSEGNEAALPQQYRVVVAFDTAIAKEESKGGSYLAPTEVDVSLDSRFIFSAQPDDVAWFLAEPWVDAWLQKLFVASKGVDLSQLTSSAREKYGLDHVAHYLTFLSAISQLCRLPEIRFIDGATQQKHTDPVKVDLVLDIGNNRSMALLMEEHDDLGAQSLQGARVLSLRDLSMPANIYIGAFESHVEFMAPSFGDAALSRQSGRSDAFNWPSFARVGTEAARSAALASSAGIGTGASGISSPKRYLWDCRPIEAGWKFAGTAAGNLAAAGRVSGPLLQYLTEDGDVRARHKNSKTSLPAVRPKFSRSSLLSFFLCEVLLQAITQMNSPFARAQQPHSNSIRQLRRIVTTTPVGMPPEECRLLQRRLDAAVDLIWQALGWSSVAPGAGPPKPEVVLGIDEAMASQTVYLYDQLAQKFSGPFHAYLALKGKPRGETGAQPALRIASIDIGAGATGLAVATYTATDDLELSVKQQLRVGVHVGGDDVMRAVVLNQIIPAIEAHLKAIGLDDPQGFLRNLLNDKALGQSSEDDLFRKRFVTQVLSPLARVLVGDYEKSAAQTSGETIARPIASWLQQYRGSWRGETNRKVSGADAFAEFDDRAVAAGGEASALASAMLSYRADKLSTTIRDVLGGVLADLSDISSAMDCDLCLVSGRPSHLPDVMDLLLSRMPVRPDRIIMMHEYQPALWYPLRDAGGCIADAKTVVALGALVQELAQGRLDGFSLAIAEADGRDATAKADRPSVMQRFIGRIDNNGQLTGVKAPGENSNGRGISSDSLRSADDSGRLVVLEVNEEEISGGKQPPLAGSLEQLSVAAPAGTEANLNALTIKPATAVVPAQDNALQAANVAEETVGLLKKADGAVIEGALGAGSSETEGDMRQQLGGHWLDTGVIGPY